MNGSADPYAVAELVVDSRRWPLDPSRVSTIGRDGHCDITVDHPEVSRRHAEISFRPMDGWVVRDLGSTNGIYQAGRRVQQARLGAQAVILGTSPDAPALRAAPRAGTGAGGAAPPEGTLREGTIVIEGRGRQAPITIGRGADNTLPIDDPLVSRHHASATREGDGFRVEDLGSLNGTYVNGVAIRNAHLGPHDLLSIGHLELRVIDGQLQACPRRTEVSLVANHLRVVLPGGKTLLSDVSFQLPESSLLAVIGPSGAGKSTLLNALTGGRRATSGSVLFDGRDLYENFGELRHRIGVVPQDDIVHRQLTVRQALGYASELRFPADLDKPSRRARIEEVIDELGLRKHVDTRIARLSGGQRKRTSVALELLSRPSLLFLDEPTSGLDPALDRSVMQTLRGLADGGRTVVVTTHNVANLGLCDRILLLAPGGRVAFYGPPDRLLRHFRAGDYSDVFSYVAEHPDDATAAFAAYEHATAAAPVQQPRPTGELAPLPRQSLHRQVSTLFRRHVRVLTADRSYAGFMAALPLVLAALVMTVPGSAGFGALPRPPTNEPMQLLVVLIVGAAFMGMASSSRDLVGERPIYRRERSVGLSAAAYLAAKLTVFGLLAALQSAVLVGVVLAVKDSPDQASLLPWAWLELYLVVAATAFASAVLGLVVSAVASTSEQVMPLLVISIMAQLVLCGGLIPIADRAGLEQLSWLAPSRWGFAAGASTVDVLTKVPGQSDQLWEHTAGMWLLAQAMLLLIAVVGVAITARRLHALDQ